MLSFLFSLSVFLMLSLPFYLAKLIESLKELVKGSPFPLA
jgi:hypothetical protein